MNHRRTSTTSTEKKFDSLYQIHHRAVLAYCARRSSRFDAWDATAEVFLVSWRRIDEVPPPGQARAWLLGVAHRVLANQRRSAHRRRRLAERAAGTAMPKAEWPDEVVVQSEGTAEVLESLERLSATDREILRLTLWEELSPVEIAHVLRLTRAAVDQRYSRAKRRLARNLDRHRNVARRATRTTTESGGMA